MRDLAADPRNGVERSYTRECAGFRRGGRVRTSFFSFSMSLSTRCEPMKPAPPVTRIRRFAWINRHGSQSGSGPREPTKNTAGREGEIAHLEELGEAERRGRRRRAGDGVLAVAAIGLLLRHGPVRCKIPPESNQSALRKRNRHAREGKGRELRTRDLRGEGSLTEQAGGWLRCELARTRAV
jgi:hypothetical protein